MDDTEFERFVAARSGQLYRSALLLTTSPHAAEDLLQTALTKAYVAWPRVRAADDPVAYVHGVLLKAFLSDRRRRSSTELAVAEPTDVPVPGVDPSERLALMAALRDLAPLDRAVVVLRFWEDHSVAETARQLGLSEAAVKNRCLRALRTLRGLLTDSFPTSPRSAR
ncbi:SigE family RNA polymerase sigma factor [Nocardioides sp. CER19]|uniref:SigE family RNA polymerase sigma factor n=1 Tax=Nocardioides sp. CER19 TaxID=3038538 RepID=UPI0024474923|nr:SigE family RNA polymerase sigma factor [Nocardioides sp. CER19]MDH2415047.1 SigE family RNA polymerase sigma factor [Nocardioides sp. CER19]